MPSDLDTLVAIAVVAAVTFATRLAGPALMRRISVTPRVERFLEALSISVIAAILASFVAQGGVREAFAVLVAAVVMRTARSAIWAMVLGMAFAATWTALAA